MIRVINNNVIYILESNMDYPFQRNYSREDMIFYDISNYNTSNEILISFGFEILNIEMLKEKIEDVKETDFRNDEVKDVYTSYLNKVLLKMLHYNRDEKIKEIVKEKIECTLCLAC